MIFVCLLTIAMAESEYEIKPDEGEQVVYTYMGVDAVYVYGPVDYYAYEYSCKELVDKFYQKYFGKDFHRDNTVEKCSPIPGAVALFEGPHWAIVKEVRGDKVVLFEQNWKNQKGEYWYAKINREVDINACPFYKLKGVDYNAIFGGGVEKTYKFTITSEPEFIYHSSVFEGKENERRDFESMEVEGYTFSHWEYEGSIISDPQITLIFDRDDEIKAVYKKISKITIKSEPEFIYKALVLEGYRGESKEVNVKQVEGYVFKHWECDGETIEAANVIFNFLNYDYEAKAVYEKIEEVFDILGKWKWNQGSYNGYFTLTRKNGVISGVLDDIYEGTYGDKILDVKVDGGRISFTRDGRYGIQYWKGLLKEIGGKLIIDDGLYKKKNRDGWRDFYAEKVESNPKKNASVYTVNMTNIDDEVTLYINDEPLFISKWGNYGCKPDWYYVAHQPGESGEIDITPYLHKGENSLRFVLWNSSGCCYTSLSFEIKKDGVTLFSDELYRSDSSSGIKYDETYIITVAF